ncbi:HNH endonuclease [Burkholderia cenocepacia]|uniref:HNH endonuclease n=1 Tax=Burkholderia cenocepacia TaxID=95486 RepID=UPI00222F2224|nr:HNH endonuclease [Burkholderia cenocepacia]MCW3678793.1 HNH endonuclease [Burkholderia cenocepacia]
MKNTITIERLRELLAYEPATGILRWRVVRGAGRPGRIAGSVNEIGRVIVRIDRKQFKAHILAWALYYGAWPSQEIDHRDRNPQNNKIRNLRLSTRSQNTCNQGLLARNTTGFKGVSYHKRRRRYVARIALHGKPMHLGYFTTAKAAHAAYSAAAKELHGEFACVA